MGFYKNGSSTSNKCEKQLQSFEVSKQIKFWKPNHWIASKIQNRYCRWAENLPVCTTYFYLVVNSTDMPLSNIFSFHVYYLQSLLAVQASSNHLISLRPIYWSIFHFQWPPNNFSPLSILQLVRRRYTMIICLLYTSDAADE